MSKIIRPDFGRKKTEALDDFTIDDQKYEIEKAIKALEDVTERMYNLYEWMDSDDDGLDADFFLNIARCVSGHMHRLDDMFDPGPDDDDDPEGGGEPIPLDLVGGV